MTPLIIIPSRMASTRLPGKPLADIHGKPMIMHVYDRVTAGDLGPTYVACGDDQIAQTVVGAGGGAVLTDPSLASGTDRVNAAADLIDPDKAYEIIVNVQGDMPTIDPGLIESVVQLLIDFPDCDIATAVVATDDASQKQDPNTVKAVLTPSGRALYFSRAAVPFGDGPIFHHIGLYAYRRETLKRFCALPPSPLELRESLEQLRALEAGMVIYAAVGTTAPISVDTAEDLERARLFIKPDKD